MIWRLIRIFRARTKTLVSVWSRGWKLSSFIKNIRIPMNSSGCCMSFLGLEACSSLGENCLPNQSWDPPSYRYPSPLHSLKRTTKRSWPAPWQVGLGAKNCPLLNWQQTPPENGWLEDDFPFEMASFHPRTVSFLGAQWTNVHHFSGMWIFWWSWPGIYYPKRFNLFFWSNLCMVQIPNLPTYILEGAFAAAFFEGFAMFNHALLRHT